MLRKANKVFSVKLWLLLGLILISTGCTPASYSASEAITGGIIGGGLGTGLGALFGSEVGNYTENMALNAAIGAGIGLIGGALLHEQHQEIDRQKALVARQAQLIDENQKE